MPAENQSEVSRAANPATLASRRGLENPCRNWVFTLNNFTGEEVEQLNNYLRSNCSFAIYESEHTDRDAEGTPHLQGYFKLIRKTRLNVIKQGIPARTHLDVAMGSQQKNVEYCSKEYVENQQNGSHPNVIYFLYDPTPLEASKTTINAESNIIDVVKAYPTLTECIDKRPDIYIKYSGGLTKYMMMIAYQKPKIPPRVTWLWGSTGSGKTRYAVEQAESQGKDYWISGSGLKWFDGYYDQPIAIFDDFRKSHCTFHYLLRLLDRYKIIVEVKGGSVYFNPEQIFITAPQEPREMFKYVDMQGNTVEREDIGQLMRRIQTITHIGMPAAQESPSEDAFMQALDEHIIHE